MPSTRTLDASRARRYARLFGILVLAVFLAGCSGILADTPELPPPEEATDRYQSLDSFSASYTTEVTTSNGTERWTGRVVVRPGTGQRYQNVSRGDRPPVRLVSNGSVRWIYDTNNESITRINITRESAPQQRRIRHVVEQVTDSGNGSLEPGIPTAPVVPSGDSSPPGQLNASITDARYEGVETVGERRAHVIVVETTAEADVDYRQVTYLDTEWFVLLKGESEMVADGERYHSEFRFDNITFNPDVSDDRFEFEPPDDAAVNTTSFDRAEYGSRAELVRTTEAAVPDPEVPDRFELQRAQRSVSENVTTLTLRYSSGTTGLFVGKHSVTGGNFTQSEDGEPVDVGNRTGRYRRVGTDGLLEWTCNESRYTVGGNLPKAKLVDVAESIECE